MVAAGLVTRPAKLRTGESFALFLVQTIFNDMGTITGRLVQHMLDRGWSESRIQKILGNNFLRVLGDIRP